MANMGYQFEIYSASIPIFQGDLQSWQIEDKIEEICSCLLVRRR